MSANFDEELPSPGRVARLACRVGPALRYRARRFVAEPLERTVSRIAPWASRTLAAARYRRKYGSRFVSKIDPGDDLLHFALHFMRSKPRFRYYHAARMYMAGGEENADDVERVLAAVGRSLGDADSVLEFACGYGRVTRHLVHRVSRAKITVSDIDERGVAFVRREFAVDGFYSVTAAEDLVHDGRYDVIVVVSLFSHLSIEDWTPWLKRLYAMLDQDGVLLFSTLGAQAYSAVGDRAFEAKAEGFLYNPENETRGRLVGEHYGAAYVTEGYVEGVVTALPSARLLGYWPAALNHFQDVYVVQRAGVTAAQISTSPLVFTSPRLSGSLIEARGQ